MAHLANVTRFPGVIGTFMGRDALSLAASYLALTASDMVLLPVYTCQEVLQSFVRKARVIFYDVRPDLTIDPDEVRSKLKGSRVKMMLITNYFGFLQPYRKEIKEMCVDRGICLIEDCAHSLLTEGSGETGDLSVYSFRKILPLPDGGGLRVNIEGRPPVPKYYPRVYSNALSVAIMTKKLLGVRTKSLSRGVITSRTEKFLPNATAHKKDERILPLSNFAQNSMAKSSFPQVMQKRREDFEFWQRVSEGAESLVPVFETLPSNVCPQGFPVRVKDRDLLESRLRAKGIQLAVHWRLDSTLGRECRTSYQLSTEMLTLPVYPELENKVRKVITGIVTGR